MAIAVLFAFGVGEASASGPVPGVGIDATVSAKCKEKMFGGPIYFRKMKCKRAQNLYKQWWHAKKRKKWKNPYSAIRVSGYRCWIKKWKGKRWVSHVHCKKGKRQIVAQWGEGSVAPRPGDLL